MPSSNCSVCAEVQGSGLGRDRARSDAALALAMTAALHCASDTPSFAILALACRPEKCQSELRVVVLAVKAPLRVQRGRAATASPIGRARYEENSPSRNGQSRLASLVHSGEALSL